MCSTNKAFTWHDVPTYKKKIEYLLTHLLSYPLTLYSSLFHSFRMNKPRAQRRPPVGGNWASSEDMKLKAIVAEHGPKNWKKIADILGETRTDVQCLHRWNKVCTKRGRGEKGEGKRTVLRMLSVFSLWLAICHRIVSSCICM